MKGFKVCRYATTGITWYIVEVSKCIKAIFNKGVDATTLLEAAWSNLSRIAYDAV